MKALITAYRLDRTKDSMRIDIDVMSPMDVVSIMGIEVGKGRDLVNIVVKHPNWGKRYCVIDVPERLILSY